MSIAECHQESFCCYTLSQDSSIWFYLRPLAYLVSDSQPSEQCQRQIPSHRIEIKSNLQSDIGWLHPYYCASTSSKRFIIVALSFVAGLTFAFLVWQSAENLPVPRTVVYRGEGCIQKALHFLQCIQPTHYVTGPQYSHFCSHFPIVFKLNLICAS